MSTDRFEIVGVNPSTGKVAGLCLLSRSVREARRHAEMCGLLFVQVRAAPGGPGRAGAWFWGVPYPVAHDSSVARRHPGA